MAEGFLRAVAGDRMEACSAGTEPSTLHPLAVEVMQEFGIDISGHRSKGVEEFLDTQIEWVVTVCSSAKQKCPVFTGAAQSLHWDLDDPAAVQGSREEKLAAFRSARDKIFPQILHFFGNY